MGIAKKVLTRLKTKIYDKMVNIVIYFIPDSWIKRALKVRFEFIKHLAQKILCKKSEKHLYSEKVSQSEKIRIIKLLKSGESLHEIKPIIKSLASKISTGNHTERSNIQELLIELNPTYKFLFDPNSGIDKRTINGLIKLLDSDEILEFRIMALEKLCSLDLVIWSNYHKIISVLIKICNTPCITGREKEFEKLTTLVREKLKIKILNSCELTQKIDQRLFENTDFIIKTLLNPQWDRGSSVLKQLEQLEQVVRNLRLVGNPRCDDAINEEETYLITSLSNTDLSIKAKAAEALGKIGSDRAVDDLIKLLSDTDGLVRANAAEALWKIGSNRAVDALITSLSDINWRMRVSAVEVLGKIGSDRAVDD